MLEYKIIKIPKSIKEIEEQLNNLSEVGWKLVCPCGKDNRHLIFKRIKRDD